MGRLILCEETMAKKPYHMKESNIHIYSYEELCFYIRFHLPLWICEQMNFQFYEWIEEQLSMASLAQTLRKEHGNIRKITWAILHERFYLDSGEIEKIMSDLDLYANKERKDGWLAKGRHYMHCRKYQKSQKCYSYLLSHEELLNQKEELAEIYYNLGKIQTKYFAFEEAKKSFQKAYEICRWNEALRSWFVVDYVFLKGKDETIPIKEYDRKKYVEELEETLEQIENGRMYKKIMEGSNQHEEDWDDEKSHLLHEWKKEFLEQFS